MASCVASAAAWPLQQHARPPPVLLSVEFGRPVLHLLGGTSTSKKTTTLQPNTPPSGPLTTETWANASAPSTLTKPKPSGLQRTTGPPTAFLKRASCNDALSQGRSTKSAARPMPPATGPSSGEGQASLLQLAGLLNLLGAPLALVHLVGRHDPVLALGVLDLLRQRVVHRQHVNASASGKAKLPATSRPWTLAMLHYHVSENSRSGCFSACVDACSLFRVCSP